MNIFISYSREDIDIARRLFDWLKSSTDFDPWIDSENLLPGMDWELEILTTIKSAKAILLLISKHSVNKVGYIQKEIKEVISRFDYFPPNEIFIIPIRLDDTMPKYPMLEKLHWIDLYLDWNKGTEKIIKALGKIAPTSIIDNILPRQVSKTYEDFPEELLEMLYKYREIDIEEYTQILDGPNYKILKNKKTDTSALAYLDNNKLIMISKVKMNNALPLNAEQCFYYWALQSKQFNVVCLSGASGTGKSFLTSNYLLNYVMNKKIFIIGNNEKHIKIYKYLIENISTDKVDKLINSKRLNLLSDLLDLTLYELSNSIIVCYLDKTAQYHEIKEMLLMMQDNTKFIIISRCETDTAPIWLTTLYNRLKAMPFFTYIIFNKIQRSKLSMKLNEIL